MQVIQRRQLQLHRHTDDSAEHEPRLTRRHDRLAQIVHHSSNEIQPLSQRHIQPCRSTTVNQRIPWGVAVDGPPPLKASTHLFVRPHVRVASVLTFSVPKHRASRPAGLALLAPEATRLATTLAMGPLATRPRHLPRRQRAISKSGMSPGFYICGQTPPRALERGSGTLLNMGSAEDLRSEHHGTPDHSRSPIRNPSTVSIILNERKRPGQQNCLI